MMRSRQNKDGRDTVAAAPAKKSRRNRPAPRVRLLESATNLFMMEGIRVIGIDRVLREADVAKASLYSLYGSKDALVTAYIEAMDEQYRKDWTDKAVLMADPIDKVLIFFDMAIEQEPVKNFRASHFKTAANEYPNPEADSEREIVAACQAHRTWLLSTVTALLNAKNGYPSETQARQIIVLLEGGLEGARLDHSVEPLITAREMARTLLSVPPADYSI